MLFFSFFNIWLHQVCASCGMWDPVSWLGTEPGPPALGAQSFSHWTTSEVPKHIVLLLILFFWQHWAAFGILVSRPGIDPEPPVMEVQSLNHVDSPPSPAMFFIIVHILKKLSSSASVGRSLEQMILK